MRAISFRQSCFASPAGLVAFLQEQRGTARLRPDQRMMVMRDWEETRDRE